jgi:hypothetical protein
MIAVDLLLKVLLALCQVLQCAMHALHLLLTLESLAMLAANVTGNSIENALESITPSYLSVFLELQEEKDRMCLYFLEGQTATASCDFDRKP